MLLTPIISPVLHESDILFSRYFSHINPTNLCQFDHIDSFDNIDRFNPGSNKAYNLRVLISTDLFYDV